MQVHTHPSQTMLAIQGEVYLAHCSLALSLLAINYYMQTIASRATFNIIYAAIIFPPHSIPTVELLGPRLWSYKYIKLSKGTYALQSLCITHSKRIVVEQER